MGAGLFHGVEHAGGFDDILRAAVIPGDLGSIALAVDPDLLAVDDEVPVIVLHRIPESPEHGVIFHLIDHVIQIRIPQVDAADLITAAATLHHDPQSYAANAAEAVNAYLDRHKQIPSALWALICCFHYRRVF